MSCVIASSLVSAFECAIAVKERDAMADGAAERDADEGVSVGVDD